MLFINYQLSASLFRLGRAPDNDNDACMLRTNSIIIKKLSECRIEIIYLQIYPVSITATSGCDPYDP